MSRAKHDSDAALELVVFDFDGTLADSAQWMRGVIDQMAIKHHFRRVEEHEIEVLRGRTTREILEHLGIDTWRLPFIARDVRRLSADAAGEIGLFAGVTELLEQLARDRIRIAVLTSNGERAVRAVLGKHAELVRHYVCGASLFGKAPKLAKLVRSLDVAAAKVLCVGDETRDIEAARKVGLPVAAVTWGYANETILRAANPDYLVDTVAQLRELCALRHPPARTQGWGP